MPIAGGSVCGRVQLTIGGFRETCAFLGIVALKLHKVVLLISGTEGFWNTVNCILKNDRKKSN